MDRLADELGVLRQVLDEFRAVFAWAVRNDKLACPDRIQNPQFSEASQGAEAESDDDHDEALTAAGANCG